MLRLPWSFGAGVSRDALQKLASPRPQKGHSLTTFTSVLERGLGTTICKEFYFPYAVKIWGLPPEELSAIQAYRRVSAGSLSKIMRKMLNSMPGEKSPGPGGFITRAKVTVRFARQSPNQPAGGAPICGLERLFVK
ncbi:MAG: hypothetical protein WKF84_22955 [Pyrinomonadaceae bacterium]